MFYLVIVVTNKQTNRQTNAGDYIIPRKSFRGDSKKIGNKNIVLSYFTGMAATACIIAAAQINPSHSPDGANEHPLPIHGSFWHTRLLTKHHLDWFIHFCRVHWCDKTQTGHETCDMYNNRPYLCYACGVVCHVHRVSVILSTQKSRIPRCARHTISCGGRL